MNYDKNTREGRHLTPEERIALQAEEIKQLQRENEQLWAQVARMREACILGYSYLSLIFHRADINNWNEVGMCSVKDIKHVLDELESAYKGGNTPADYHNPADVEALRKAREALEQTKGFIKGIGCYCNYEGEYASQCQPCFIVEQIDKALTAIDKAIGGKEDV